MKKKQEEIIKRYQMRHACKQMDPSRKIPSDQFDTLFEVARLSPSSMGMEPWKILVVQDYGIREKMLAFTWGAQDTLKTASHFIVVLARKKEDMIYSSKRTWNFIRTVQKMDEEAAKAKIERMKVFQKTDLNLLESDRAIFDWACKQTYIMMGNLLTAAAELGIDTCPIEGFNQEAAEKFLVETGMMDPKHFGLSYMLAFGYRAVEPKREKTRQKREDIVQWYQ